MHTSIIGYIPALPRERTSLAGRSLLGVPLALRSGAALLDAGLPHVTFIVPPRLRSPLLKAWRHHLPHRLAQITILPMQDDGTLSDADWAQLIQTTVETVLPIDALTLISVAHAGTLVETATTGRPDVTGEFSHVMPRAMLRRWLAAQPSARAQPAQSSDRAGRRRPLADQWSPQSHADWCAMEQWLTEQIRQGANGWVAKTVNKRVSLPLSRWLARRRIHPHLITIVNMCIGLAAGIGTAGVTYASLCWGGLLFQLASILDGCDGEVAKLTHRSSKFGQLLDTLSDNLTLFSFFTGLIIHHYRVGSPQAAMAWGFVLLSGLGLVILIMVDYLRKESDSRSLVTYHKQFLEPFLATQHGICRWGLHWGKELFKKEWYSLLICLLAIIGVLPALLYVVALVVWIGVACLATIQYGPRRALVNAGRTSISINQKEYVCGADVDL
ncbi:MAG: CDP-alcohol phosphatidyltransferase family protein [Deltaproteobacteria bacterium]|nr:CDP-alcohol phosphatidyltransferase family protein [Deltaproteobacteria bacterium]